MTHPDELPTDELRAQAQALLALTDEQAVEIVRVDVSASRKVWRVTFADGRVEVTRP
jgi:hypothetical protein